MNWKSWAAALCLHCASQGISSAQDDYFEWADASGLIGVFADPEADFDEDGITNLMAYAFDLAPMNDPEAWDKLPLLAFIGDPPEPIMIFLLPPEIPRDVSYIVELVTDSGERIELARKNGRGAWKGEGELSKQRLEDGCTEITVQVPLTFDLPEGPRPLRLRVEFLP